MSPLTIAPTPPIRCSVANLLPELCKAADVDLWRRPWNKTASYVGSELGLCAKSELLMSSTSKLQVPTDGRRWRNNRHRHVFSTMYLYKSASICELLFQQSHRKLETFQDHEISISRSHTLQKLQNFRNDKIDTLSLHTAGCLSNRAISDIDVKRFK